MAHFEEHTDQPYDWSAEGVYVIECDDPVEGGADGVSNRQAAELTRRTRNLHQRLAEAEGEIDTLEEHTPIAIEAAKRSAIEHTEATAAAVRDELALGNQMALRTAKEYADQIVSALVDGSPELLNTLQELAGALGNDPNFATTVMTAISERVKTTDFTAALASKFDKTGGHINGMVTTGAGYSKAMIDTSGVSEDAPHAIFGAKSDDGKLGYLRVGGAGSKFGLTYHPNGIYNEFKTIYHSGNFDPSGLATTSQVEMELEKKLDKAGGEIKTLDVRTNTAYCLRLATSSQSNEAWIGVIDSQGNCPGYLRIGANKLQFHPTGNDIDAKDIYHSGNLKIIRGSVDAAGANAGGNAEGVGGVYGEPAVVRVTHNLGTTAYSATASAVSNTVEVHSDNVVTVWRKAANYTDFVVTEGPGTGRELCAFDYMIIPY